MAIVVFVDFGFDLFGIGTKANRVLATRKLKVVDLACGDAVAADGAREAGADLVSTHTGVDGRGLGAWITGGISNDDQSLSTSSFNRGVRVQDDLLNLQVGAVEDVDFGTVVVFVSLSRIIRCVSTEANDEAPSWGGCQTRSGALRASTPCTSATTSWGCCQTRSGALQAYTPCTSTTTSWVSVPLWGGSISEGFDWMSFVYCQGRGHHSATVCSTGSL